MRVCITGHRGYIGAVLVPILKATGHDVFGFDTDLYEGCDFGGVPEACPQARKDIREITAADLEGFDAIVHLAGLSNDPLGDIDPDLTHDINTVGTLSLAKNARSAGVPRFLFSSSCSNYGAAGDEWLNESSPLKPVTPYAVSKVRCEEGLDALATPDFTPVHLRSSTAYGMSPRIRFDLVANNLTAWAIATGQIRLKSDGSAWRPLVHAEDMAQAFIRALEAPRHLVDRQAFNVGRNDDCMQVRDVANLVKAAIPEAEITFSPDRIVDTRTYRVDCSKILKLGFHPKWDVERGIAQIRDAFRTVGVSVADFEGSRYQRVAHIKARLANGELDESLRPREGAVV